MIPTHAGGDHFGFAAGFENKIQTVGVLCLFKQLAFFLHPVPLFPKLDHTGQTDQCNGKIEKTNVVKGTMQEKHNENVV